MKSGEFDKTLLEYGETLKTSYSGILSNAGKIIALVSAIIAVLVCFTEIEFLSLGSASLTSSLAVTLVCSYLIYFSLEDAGEKLGLESDEYRSAEGKYSRVRDNITPEMIPALRVYCTEYSLAEAKFRRCACLMEGGVSPEEFERATEHNIKVDKEDDDRIDVKVGAFGSHPSKVAGLDEMGSKRVAKTARFGVMGGGRVAKAIRKASKIKPIFLTPSLLLGRAISRASELSNPRSGRFFRLAVQLLPSTLCTVFTASVILTAKADLTAATVIESLLKLSTLPLIGFRGYSEGYSYTRYSASAWLETKARLLEGFLNQYSREKSAET